MGSQLSGYRASRIAPNPARFTVLALGTAASAALILIATSTTLPAMDTPLADAAERKDWKQLHELLQRSGDPNDSQVDGMTALHWATWHDDTKSVLRLVEAGATVTATNRYGVTPLSLACRNGNRAIAKRLLESGAAPITHYLVVKRP